MRRQIGAGCLIFVFTVMAVSSGFADDAEIKRGSGTAPIVKLLKSPVSVVKDLAVAKAKMDRKVTTTMLHFGIDMIKSSLRWLTRAGGGDEGTNATPRQGGGNGGSLGGWDRL